jgi:hypothetical protein
VLALFVSGLLNKQVGAELGASDKDPPPTRHAKDGRGFPG